MNSLQVAFIAFIQAATEFLPISSSGHSLFLKGIFHLEELPLMFDILIHTGSLLAIIIFFFPKIVSLIKGFFSDLGNKALPLKNKSNVITVSYLIISSMITVILYLIFQPLIDAEFTNPKILPYTFLITTLFLSIPIIVKKIQPQRVGGKTGKKNLLFPVIIGFVQGIAIFPGISRSGSTISSALSLGSEKEDAFFYSFMLAIIAIAGAALLSLLDAANFSFIRENLFLSIIAFFISFTGSLFFLWLLKIVMKKNGFSYFAIYTLAMAIVSFILFR